jgi:predicted transcriptional regulator of viral defense system
MEIERGVLQYLVALYNKSTECSRLSEVSDYIKRLSTSQARNRLGIILESITLFIRSIENMELSALKAQGKLGDFQKNQWEAPIDSSSRRRC